MSSASQTAQDAVSSPAALPLGIVGPSKKECAWKGRVECFGAACFFFVGLWRLRFSTLEGMPAVMLSWVLLWPRG